MEFLDFHDFRMEFLDFHDFWMEFLDFHDFWTEFLDLMILNLDGNSLSFLPFGSQERFLVLDPKGEAGFPRP